MRENALDGLLRVAERLHNEDSGSLSELMIEEQVPTDLRLVLAACVLAAADRPTTKLAITQASGAARSGVYRDHPGRLDQASKHLPALVGRMLDRAGDGQSQVELRRQLDLAHASIARERERRAELEDEVRHVVAYAAELHAMLKLDQELHRQEQEAKVRRLRPATSRDD